MSDAERSRDTDRQSDLAVMDTQEYKQKRRLERLLDVLEKVEAKANEAWDLFVAGDINHDAKNIIVQRAVKEAVREAYNQLVDHEANVQDEGKHSEYWVGYEGLKETENGLQPVVGDGGATPIGRIEQESHDDIVVWGLADFMETKEFYEETIEETTKPRNQPVQAESRHIKKTVQEEVSWNAYLRLKRFLNRELNLDIEFDEGPDVETWGYYDIPEEEKPDGELIDE